MDIKGFPDYIQEAIRFNLRLYDKCYVIYENGKYLVKTNMVVRKRYPADYKFICEVSVDDVYTIDERTVNYVEEFRSYPSWYKGKKDHGLINSLKVGDKVVLVNGDIRLAKEAK